MYKNTQIIAEVKTKSPFGYTAKNTWEELFEVANTIGDIVSIHTDSRWGGSFELITQARKLTKKPILAKGIHKSDDEITKALQYGADFVLVVGRIPKIENEKCFIEPLTLAELVLIPTTQKVVWNSRDLTDGSLKSEIFDDARKKFGGWLCQASNIKTTNDIKEGADAALVGTHLLDFAKTI